MNFENSILRNGPCVQQQLYPELFSSITSSTSQMSRSLDLTSAPSEMLTELAIDLDVSPRSSSTSTRNKRTTNNLSPLLPDLFTAATMTSGAVSDVTLERRVEDSYPGLQMSTSEPGTFTLSCCRPGCLNQHQPLRNARAQFKSCHNCYTFYCSKHCRQLNWTEHKISCAISCVASACKRALQGLILETSSPFRVYISNLARVGYFGHGRGCVLINLQLDHQTNVSKAANGHPSAIFIPLRGFEVEKKERCNISSFDGVMTQCRHYDPEAEIVCVLTAKVAQGKSSQANAASTTGVAARPRKCGNLVRLCVTLPLSTYPDPLTVSPLLREKKHRILVVTGRLNSDSLRDRQIFFMNVQRKLRERRVDLSTDFPHVYRKLINYVDQNERFAPITIYPVDGRTNMMFMCALLPSSDPVITWSSANRPISDLSMWNL